MPYDLHTAVSDFIDYKVTRYGSTEATRVTYKSSLGDFLKRVPINSVEELTLDAIDGYIDEISKLGYKPKTFKNKIVVVRSFVRYLYSKNLSDIRPESIILPRVQDVEANFLDYGEQAALLAVIPNKRDYAIVKTLLRSGIRVSELIDMRTDDLFERSVVVRHGKGRKSRVTFITEKCETAIRDYLDTKPYTTYMFTNHAGEKLSRQYIARIVSIYGSMAVQNKKVSPHTLRHSFATNMLRMGARIEDVQPMMGHANISTTRLYMHFTNDYLHQRYDEIMSKKA